LADDPVPGVGTAPRHGELMGDPIYQVTAAPQDRKNRNFA
jgi:hypothetical protein